MSEWRDFHVGFEDDGLTIEGADVWRQVWRPTRAPALQMHHPSYPNQLHTFEVVEIGSLDRPVRFAVGELSNGVWGFYVPTQSSL
jgi:hypothetical protein